MVKGCQEIRLVESSVTTVWPLVADKVKPAGPADRPHANVALLGFERYFASIRQVVHSRSRVIDVACGRQRRPRGKSPHRLVSVRKAWRVLRIGVTLS